MLQFSTSRLKNRLASLSGLNGLSELTSLTAKQQKVLTFIESYIESNGSSPSLFDLKSFLGVRTLGSVHAYLKALERKGLLQKDRAVSNGINYVVRTGKYIGSFIRVPMVGNVLGI